MCCGSKRTELKNSLSTAGATSNRPPAGAQRRIEPLRGIESGRAATAPRAFSPLVSASAPAQIPLSATAPAGSFVASFVAISYREKAPVRVRGLTTGRTYEFSGSNSVCEVDAQDASALLNTRFFRRA